MIQNSDNITQLIKQLLEIPKFGNGVGFPRMYNFFKKEPLNIWLSKIDAIKVTGSNGKGSVSKIISAILREANFKVGLYTSPHLFNFNERMAINNINIKDSELQKSSEWVLKIIDQYQQKYPDDYYGAFEIFTAIALYYFANYQVDTMVAEAGIGGRFDPTRMIPGNTATITSLDLEHTQILGDTLEMIAYDKSELCPTGGTLIIGNINTEIFRRLEAYCNLRRVQLISIQNNCILSQPKYLAEGMIFDFQYGDLKLDNLYIKLLGNYQINNVAVAIVAAECWLRKKLPNLKSSQLELIIRNALKNVSVAGRLQKVSSQPEIYVDVGHTPDAIEKLVESIEQLWNNEPILLVTGVSYNKDIQGILEKLVVISTQVICTRAWHRGSDVSIVVDCLTKIRPDLPLYSAETIEKAIQMAKEIAKQNQMKVLIAGGLFLVAEAIQVLEGKNPQNIQFF
ncbi:MAG TPA: hypothetical protein DCF68_15570 [Cyanothece sp. UBA12306]|nr:hypothetical protein [Cyanothece sp. UBA12306]